MSVTCDRSMVSSTNETDCHDITEILLKVALNTIKQTNKSTRVIFPYSHINLCLCLNFNKIFVRIKQNKYKWNTQKYSILSSNFKYLSIYLTLIIMDFNSLLIVSKHAHLHSSAVVCGFEPCSCSTKDCRIDICCLSDKHAAIRRTVCFVIRLMCRSEVTCLSSDCCFREIAL